jgi:two-component system, OmpR family, phosphate regulon response regulator PhoB
MDNSKASVLIVEDDDSIALALEVLLSREGLVCQRARDGHDAVQCIRTSRPDLVMLDVMLPGMTGFEICRGVRNDPTLDHVRIIVMTASGSPARNVAMLAGADGFVAKPFDPAILRSEVRRLLGTTPA